MNAVRFVVSGRGSFPFEMLFHDRCHPASEEESAKLSGGFYALDRSVVLEHCSPEPDWRPSAGLWETHDWRVTQVDGADL